MQTRFILTIVSVENQDAIPAPTIEAQFVSSSLAVIGMKAMGWASNRPVYPDEPFRIKDALHVDDELNEWLRHILGDHSTKAFLTSVNV